MATTRLIITRKIEDESLKRQIWNIYKRSFEGSEKICAQNQQCYTEQEFKMALEDPDYVKYYLKTDKGICAYMLATNNLKKASITYMNPEKYLATFPKYAPDRIYYFTSLAVHSEYRSQRVFYQIISKGLQHIAKLGGIYAFDFSHETVGSLAQMFIRIAQKLHEKKLLPKLIYVKVGTQEFGAIVPK